MDTIEKVKETEFLGKDFLLWLWYKSTIGRGIVEFGEDDEDGIELRFAGKIILKSEEEEGAASVTCSGANSRFKEARFALTENKMIVSAGIKVTLEDDEEYTFTLDSQWLNFKGFRTPKVVQDDDDDPDGLFYEKIGLTEKAVSIIDNLFWRFIQLRLSEEWKEKELPALIDWVKKGRQQRAPAQG